MQALGDKIGSTIIAQSAGVPTIAWNAADLQVDYQKDGITDEVYQKANITTADEALEASVKIGFPVMIKASEGGGGKGIRKVSKIQKTFFISKNIHIHSRYHLCIIFLSYLLT